MKPYRTIRLIGDNADIADIQSQGRKSCIGQVDSEHGYIRSKAKKARVRRYLKRQDKRAASQYEMEE